MRRVLSSRSPANTLSSTISFLRSMNLWTPTCPPVPEHTWQQGVVPGALVAVLQTGPALRDEGL